MTTDSAGGGIYDSRAMAAELKRERGRVRYEQRVFCPTDGRTAAAVVIYSEVRYLWLLGGRSAEGEAARADAAQGAERWRRLAARAEQAGRDATDMKRAVRHFELPPTLDYADVAFPLPPGPDGYGWTTACRRCHRQLYVSLTDGVVSLSDSL